MKRISILAVTACCVLALALVGCAGGDHKTDTDSLKGFWVLDTDATPMGFDAAMGRGKASEMERESRSGALGALGRFLIKAGRRMARP